MSENRDRAIGVVLKNRGKQEILDAISDFLDVEARGKISFEKNGEAFSLLAAPEPEESVT